MWKTQISTRCEGMLTSGCDKEWWGFCFKPKQRAWGGGVLIYSSLQCAWMMLTMCWHDATVLTLIFTATAASSEPNRATHKTRVWHTHPLCHLFHTERMMRQSHSVTFSSERQTRLQRSDRSGSLFHLPGCKMNTERIREKDSKQRESAEVSQCWACASSSGFIILHSLSSNLQTSTMKQQQGSGVGAIWQQTELVFNSKNVKYSFLKNTTG